MNLLSRKTDIRIRLFYYLPGLITLLVLILAISGESFWLDEVTTAWLVGQTSLQHLLQALQRTGSEMQMPAFVSYMWVWGKCFGVGEVALRCANIPWAILGVTCMWRFIRQSECKSIAVLLMLLPILTFQMNEARPYIMTFALAAWSLTTLDSILHSIRENLEPAKRDLLILILALFMCLATSLLNIFLLPALFIYALTFNNQTGWFRKLLGFIKTHHFIILLSILTICLILSYYIWTVQQGYGGQKQAYTLTNMGFSCYEWLGFGGLGAPRNELREIGARLSFLKYGWTLLLGLIVWMLMGLVVLFNLRRLRSDPVVLRLLLALSGAGLMLILVAVFFGISLWGRHFIFLLPFFITLMARIILPEGQGKRSLLSHIAFVLIISVFLLSAGRQRFLQAYKKDPFRAAVLEVNRKVEPYSQMPVVWVAYDKALTVYGSQYIDRDILSKIKSDKLDSQIIYGVGWSKNEIDQWCNRCDNFILVLHRPDKTDLQGLWVDLVLSYSAECIWHEGNIRIFHVDTKK